MATVRSGNRIITLPSNSARRFVIGDGITVSESQHAELVKHIKDRLDFAGGVRDNFVQRCAWIDKEIAGYVKLDEDDKQREKDNREGKGPKTTDSVLQLVLAQIDEAVTYLLSVVAPDSQLYQIITRATDQNVASAFANVLNYHSRHYGHYRQLAKAFTNMMRYNLGGVLTEWRKQTGKRVINDATGAPQVNTGVLMQGNALENLSPYNVLWDVSVSPPEVSIKGEFFATVHIVTAFRLHKMLDDRELFDKNRLTKVKEPLHVYYRQPPELRVDNLGASRTLNWQEILNPADPGYVSNGIEIVHYYGWLRPKQFGLSRSDELEIWRITLVGNENIGNATPLNNAHGQLPCSFAMPYDDELGLDTKSPAEVLIPLQRFASFSMNILQRAQRKSLYGITVYDKFKLPLMERSDLLGGLVPAEAMGTGQRLADFIHHINLSPFTDQNMQYVSNAVELMQQLFPTDILRQVTDLERATIYQAAATVQGTNRRNYKLAKIIDDQCISGMRRQMYYNILEYQESVTILDQNGQEVEIDPAQFRRLQMEYAVSEGLQSMDKLQLIIAIKDLINMLIQAPQLQQQVDLMAIIDYWTGLLGDKTDFTQFRYKTQFDALPPEAKEQAAALLQQAVAQQEQGGASPI